MLRQTGAVETNLNPPVKHQSPWSPFSPKNCVHEAPSMQPRSCISWMSRLILGLSSFTQLQKQEKPLPQRPFPVWLSHQYHPPGIVRFRCRMSFLGTSFNFQHAALFISFKRGRAFYLIVFFPHVCYVP